MTCIVSPDLTGLLASAFLDQHGQFAKDHKFVHTVRLYFEGSSVDLSVGDFALLPSDVQQQIRNAGSAAAYL